ncbi:hypothetical protein N7491_002798 [Penicillium cf. griseofulvum]|uniref:Allergen Asp f 4 n=1 Tax=Penicillium cf. griseofulvum TaxID=2972120 RepID=A0A9W9MSK2_9EURO|nr:hypothetical protein N7472_003035 [Penicillium cf. griseofulvum]KAJ5440392.1 hypothetical protein N7491_002798 [Penicillium cf. griseofulvum]
MRGVSIPVVLAGFVGHAFAGIYHHAYGHRHRNLMPPSKDLELRSVGWDNANNSPDDFKVESITITTTTTTTVFGKCVSTNTIHSTITLVKNIPKSTPCIPAHDMPILAPQEPEPHQDHWNKLQPEPILSVPANTAHAQPQFTQPEPSAPRPVEVEGTITFLNTQTITKTTTNTITVTIYPEASHIPLETTHPQNLPEAEKAIPLAETIPNNSLEERKAVPAKRPRPPHPKSNGGPIKAVLDLPGEVLPNLPVVNQIFEDTKPNSPTSVDWTAVPIGKFSTNGFGGRTSPKGKGAEILYRGNVGKPWGSNIITVSPAEAHTYKYVARFTGSNNEPWTVVVWNKYGPDGKLTGWYGHSALRFTLAPGDTRYVAFDEDSEGAWGAAPGDHLPTDQWGGYSCTWGEFTFGDGENNGWSGWDVSAIQAQAANQPVQGMAICQADGKKCSIITPGARKVVAAYTNSKKHIDGIGGEAVPGPVRLNVVVDYRG